MWKIIISVLNVCLVLKLVCGDLDSTFHRCCSLGQNKTLDVLKCESKIRTPVIGVAIEEQSLCLSTAELCCIQALRDTSCKNGKQAAKHGRSCTTDFRTEEDLSFRYCCEACKVGIIAGSMSMCSLKTFKFDSPWEQIYKSCCEEPIQTFSTLPGPTSESSNVCDLFPGELCRHICIPVNGSYRCQCRSGFTLLADGKSCQEEVGNRCDRNNPCEQECFDNGASIECSCRSGFILQADRTSCEDIDECKDGTHKCNLQTQSCINYAGNYRCEPKEVKSVFSSGFIIDSKTNETVDINECDSKPCKKNEVCFNTVGSFKCECMRGFSWNSVTSSCIDIDECATGFHNCNRFSNCVNYIGSYQCVPKDNLIIPSPSYVQENISGFKFDANTNRMVDINECDSKPCGSYEVCNNTIGSYTCTCATGFLRDRITDACVDINECQTKRHDCNPAFQRCDNTIGSYQCVRVTSCGTGYTFNSESHICEDDDECTLGTNDCHTLGPDYECKNLVGTFRCVKKKCTNSQICGHFSAQKCPVGYFINDGKCSDVNECTSGNACPQGYSCQNTHGSFRCILNVRTTCGIGFRSNDISNRCTDIDECIEQPNICEHKCINTYGSFMCLCNQGFSLHEDNRSCIDINECELYKNRRLCASSCINEPGSYKCSCPEGYRLGSDGASCIDIDECLSQNKCRNPQEICMNMRGTYRCNNITCPENYVQEVGRKNRCSRAPYFCKFNDETCSKVPLSYSFNYITFVSNVPIPNSGQIPLFNMRGPASGVSSISFFLELKSVAASPAVPKVTIDYFYMNQTSSHSVTVLLLKSITGPQDIELNLLMHIHVNGVYSGFTVSKLFIFVSQFEF